MKVLHVIPSMAERDGGPSAAIVPMCRALQAQGVDVLLVTTDAGMSPGDLEAKRVGVPIKFFPAQWGESFKYSRPLASWLSENVRSFAVVHVHAVFNHSSVAAARACRKAGVPYVLRPLGTLDPWSVSQKSLRKRLFWRVTGKRLLLGAAAVHYTTEAEKLSTESLFVLNHGKVIPLGIRQSSSCVCSSEPLAREFPVLADGPYVLALSRLHPKKGLDVLLDAFELLTSREQFANWRLVIAGDGPVEYVSKLKRKTESPSLRDRVVFTGWLHGDIRDAVLDSASLVVQPSHQENFGLSVMEALGHSVPVLVSPHVNVAAEIAAANAGWIAAVETEALATSLSEALADEAELERRGRAGKALSLKYSWENSARALAKLYREISSG